MSHAETNETNETDPPLLKRPLDPVFMCLLADAPNTTLEDVLAFLESKPSLVLPEVCENNHILTLVLDRGYFRQFSTKDRITLVEKIFELYPDVDVNLVNGYGSRPVMYALQCGDFHTVSELISRGAKFMNGDVLISNKKRDTVDLWFCVQGNANMESKLNAAILTELRMKS